MLDRGAVFEVINEERKYQDELWGENHDRRKGSEHTILLAELYLNKAKTAWLTSKDEKPVVQQLAKMAAIIVAGLERIDGAEVILEGLR